LAGSDTPAVFTFTSPEPVHSNIDAPVEDNRNQDSGDAQVPKGPTDENIEAKAADNEPQEKIIQPKVMKKEEFARESKKDRKSQAFINHKSENSLAYKNDTSMGKTF
jgi:hypothetical protein